VEKEVESKKKKTSRTQIQNYKTEKYQTIQKQKKMDGREWPLVGEGFDP